MTFWRRHCGFMASSAVLGMSLLARFALPERMTNPSAQLAFLVGGLGAYASYVERTLGRSDIRSIMIPGRRDHRVDGAILTVVAIGFCAIAYPPFSTSVVLQTAFVLLPIISWALDDGTEGMRGRLSKYLLYTTFAIGLGALSIAILIGLWQRLLINYAATATVVALQFVIIGVVLRRCETREFRTAGTFLALNALLVLSVIIVGTVVTILGRS